MYTTRRTAERLGYIAGALFPVVLWASFALEDRGRTYPNFEDGVIGADALRETFDLSTVNRIGTVLGGIALVLLVCFASALHARATRVAVGTRTAATLALIFPSVFAGLILSTGGAYLASAFHDISRIDPSVLLVWYAGAEVINGVFVGAFLAMAGFLAATAYLGFAHSIIPKWAAWPAAVLAVTMGVGTLGAPFGDVGFAAWLSFMVFTAWMLAIGLRLSIRPEDPVAPVGDRESAPTIPLAA